MQNKPTLSSTQKQNKVHRNPQNCHRNLNIKDILRRNHNQRCHQKSGYCEIITKTNFTFHNNPLKSQRTTLLKSEKPLNINLKPQQHISSESHFEPVQLTTTQHSKHNRSFMDYLLFSNQHFFCGL